MKRRLIIAIFTLIGALPHRLRLWLGGLLAFLFPILMPKRVFIAQRNLELCFPHQNIQPILKQHIRALSQTVIDRGLLWFASAKKIQKIVHITGTEALLEAVQQQKHIILYAPHFVGLDAAATRLTMILPESATMYMHQQDPVFDEIIKEGRSRFNTVHMFSKQDGIRALVSLFRKGGIPLYFLPDMDFGFRDSIFLNFFNIPTACITSTATLARRFQALVFPVLSHWDPQTGHYHTQILPALSDFPGERDDIQATDYLNRLLEQWIIANPSQYYWVHRRFKTRPNDEECTFYEH